MHSIATTRRYELFIVLAAAAAYVTRRLNERAANFDFNINWLQNLGVSKSNILRDLSSFDYSQNVVFPTVAGAILFIAAWYVFHYHAFPKIKESNYDNSTKAFTVLAVGLTSASISLYSFLDREVMLRRSEGANPIGFQVLSANNIGSLFFSTCVALMVICLYEAFAQAYYRTIELYEQKSEFRYRTQQYVLLAIAGGCLFLWVLVGSIANLVVDTRQNMRSGSFVIILVSFLFHLLFYKIWLPYLSRLQYEAPKKTRKTIEIISIYIIINLLLVFIWKVLGGEFYGFVVIYLLPNSIGLATALVRQFLFTETQKLQTQVLRKTTELDTLRSQVNPHFLFNALNTLYSVALKESSEKTADGIQKLGDMMRFMLHENNQERIPLRKEIEYLHNFLDLQRMRLDEGHAIEIRVNIQEPDRDLHLAPMLLNPFVENAFKHGISLRQPSWVYITLALDATKLYFKVHNSLHQKMGDDPEKKNPGIGLDNVRKRLDLLYPDRHTLDIQATESDYFVSLVLEI
ncbi:sensor histidine kinase [Persicitalea sp.]|uniref:sensor histidine kinase n=1 Tax=Persicitalea sp. TaxID=3100273 RepID=UPI00359321E8